jgi:vacuolar iron transporter family protein
VRGVTSQDSSDQKTEQKSLEVLERRWRSLLAHERDAAALYDGLAEGETGERAEILRQLAAVERKHAEHWASRLREAGMTVPAAGPVGLSTRLLAATAQRVSLDAVLPLIERVELAGAGIYDQDPDAAPGMADEERHHAQALAALRTGGGPGTTRLTRDDVRGTIGRRERHHRADRSGAVRAAVFGVSDGLVSNTALVMGFAGSGAAQSTVLLAGIAGTLAGAFSMAAGEYVSMSAQREMFQREVDLEAAELRENPEEEMEELVLIYRAKGLSPATARVVAEQVFSDHETALDTLAREELGLDRDALGSPWTAAVSSMITFAMGAFVVVLPYLFTGGTTALLVAAALSLLSMVAVGAVLGLVNGRSLLSAIARQTITGVLACIVTFSVGELIGGLG